MNLLQLCGVGCVLGFLAWSSSQAMQNLELVEFTDKDVDQIKQVHRSYLQAWLDNRPESVLAAFTNEAALVPHHGDEPITGLEAIRAFWFPANSPPTAVTVYSTDIQQVEGSGELAFIRGRFKLAFEYGGKKYSNEGNFLDVYRKVGGQWKCHVHMWNDPVPETD